MTDGCNTSGGQLCEHIQQRFSRLEVEKKPANPTRSDFFVDLSASVQDGERIWSALAYRWYDAGFHARYFPKGDASRGEHPSVDIIPKFPGKFQEMTTGGVQMPG